MNRREKATLHRDKGKRLNEEWKVGATQARYSDHGGWYAALTRFPSALFDANGYVYFSTEEEYLTSPHLRLGKQISVPKPGISGIPVYVRVVDEEDLPSIDVDIHAFSASEGRQRLVLHLQRERNQTLVRRKKKQAISTDCEICGFSFRSAYGDAAENYCEVHHLLPLSHTEQAVQTQLDDLAIVCANCHRVIHLHNPPYTVDEVRAMRKS